MSRRSRPSWGPAALVVAVGLLLTAVSALALARQDDERVVVEVAARAREAGERLSAEVQQAVAGATSVAALLTVDPDTSPEAFRAHVVDGGILRNQDNLTALSFARWVPAGRVAAHDEAVRRRTGRTEGIRPAPAPGEGAVVVEMVEPLRGLESAIGFDMLSEPRRAEAIVRARDRGVPSVSAPIELVTDPSGTPSTLLFVPVYEGGGIPPTGPERRRAFLGVATSVLQPPRLLDDVLPRSSTIDVVLHAVGPVEDEAASQGVRLWSSAGVRQLDDLASPRVTVDVNVGDRRWRLTAAPNANFPRPLPAWVVAVAAGLALTAVTTLLFRQQARARDRAEALVAERTVELRDAVSQLEAADRAKSAFLSTVSHELRTPMAAIMGFVAVLLDRGEELEASRRDDLLQRVERNTRVLHRMIEDLLAYSRMERDVDEGVVAPLDLGEAVEHALDAVAGLLEDLRLERRITPGLTVLVDPVSLDRIVGNLVVNARKYAGNGASVLVEVARRGDRAVLAVSDDGPGFTPDERERVFERFERGSAAGQTRGTGIGLAVVRDLARRHGGDAAVEPRPDGARVAVTLPLAPTAADAGVPDAVDAIAPEDDEGRPEGRPGQGRDEAPTA